MWKIIVVMSVTAVFAALLIHNPYGFSSESGATTFKVASAQPTAKRVPLAPASSDVYETEATPTLPSPPSPPRHPDIVILDNVQPAPVDRIAEREQKVLGVPEWLPASLADRPLPPATNVQERPSRPSAPETTVVRPVRPAPETTVVQSTPDTRVQPLPTVAQPAPRKREGSPVSRVDVEVAVGGNDEFGVCSTGEVTGLDPNGDNFLSLRSGPGGQPYREIDRLFTADTVYVCGRKGAWYAVVYSATRKPRQNCDIAAQGTRRAYEGPCHYGWAHSNYVKVSPNRVTQVQRQR